LASGGKRFRAAFITLTYAPGQEVQPGDLSGYMQRVRVWLARKGYSGVPYVTKAEFGELRGRFHYHVLIWLPSGIRLPKADSSGMWSKGMTRMEWARRPVGYMAKYIGKSANDWEGVRSGFRSWSVGGLSRGSVPRLWVRYALLPGWLRELTGPDRDASGNPDPLWTPPIVRKTSDGWWVVDESYALRSPWRFVSGYLERVPWHEGLIRYDVLSA
jgi:hypothetical protein